MDAYIRFQSQLRCSGTGRPVGIFHAAGRVEDKMTLPESTQDRLREVLDWFNQNLKAPALDESDWRCLFWFRPTAQSIISRLWELSFLLEDEGVFVTKVRTHCPGTIVYRDEHQVAAIPQRKENARRIYWLRG